MCSLWRTLVLALQKKESCNPRAADPEKQKEACVTENWKEHSAYIKTLQTEKTNSVFNHEP